MEDIYKTPESSLSNGVGAASRDYQLFKVSGIGVATFFGTLLAGGFLMYRNYKNLGKDAAANKALLYSALATVAVFVIAMLIPEGVDIPNIVFTIPQIIAIVQIAKKQQGSDLERHVEEGGQLASDWKAFGISLIVLIGVMAILIPVAMLFV
jgi:hypothetical protein